ncbi:nucleolin [Taenia crassiceps]|uniref:Nucleolin n=1 Tax=Taenia crassiceps TaxID=6207 RepID=A0ABR4Q6Z7_9CEST
MVSEAFSLQLTRLNRAARSRMESSSGSADLEQLIRNRMTELNDRTLLVSHLPRALQLKALIRAFKTSANARFPTKKLRGNRKYAFLEFPSASHAKRALEESTKFKFLGRSPKYISNDLPRDATVDDVRRLFPDAVNVEFPTAGPGKAQGCARIDFTAKKDALAAFKTMHGVLLHNVPIIVNYCVRKKAGKRNKVQKDANEKGENIGTSSLSGSEIMRRKRLHSNDGGIGNDKKDRKVRRISACVVDRSARNPGSRSLKSS